jgi:hypothetical protein
VLVCIMLLRIAMQVPILTASVFSEVLPAGVLVRYRGMVQSSFSPVFHEPAIPEETPSGVKWHMGRYAPVGEFPSPDSLPPVRGSQMPFYCVPVPAQGEWARDLTLKGAKEAAAEVKRARSAALMSERADMPRSVRRRPRDDDVGDEEMTPPSPAVASTSAAVERGDSPCTLPATPQELQGRVKRHRHPTGYDTEEEEEGEGSHGSEVAPLDVYNPLPGHEKECPCIASLYAVGSDTPLRPGQLVEMFGILARDVVDAKPGASAFEGSLAAQVGLSEFQLHLMSQPEYWALNPSAALVPRLNVIVWRTLSPTFPLLNAPLTLAGPFALQDVLTCSRRVITPPPPPAPDADQFVQTEAVVAAATVSSDPMKAFDTECRVRNTALDAQGEAALSALPGVCGGMSLVALRAEMLRYLQVLCAGDEVAAEFLLLALCSRVVSRPGDRTIGKVSVNISHFPESSVGVAPASSSPPSTPSHASKLKSLGVPVPLEDGASFWGKIVHAGLRHVAVRAAALPLSRVVLDNVDILPKKDNVLDRLRAGVLQLPDGTTLVVDETYPMIGEYAGKAVKALHALKTLAQSSKALYDFSVTEASAMTHFVPMPVDFGVVVISASRSVLDCDVTIPLSEAAQALALETALARSLLPPPTEEFTSRARMYLATIKFLPFSFPDDLRTAVEADLVALKASGTKESPVTDRDLFRLMDEARLVAASMGATVLTADHWSHVKRLEIERRRRVGLLRAAASPPSAPPTPPRTQ